MDQASPTARCPRCGAELPATDLDGLCAACLMAAGAGPASSRAGGSRTESTSNPAEPVSARLTGGQQFGRYRIERLIGRGGMGEVYAAEQIDSGRRLAIKVLNERLAGPQDRARFLREGQLAASVSHPNSVYIFGSEEIDGTPVISMELLPGGTLKDVVRSTGPLAPAAAVDSILQILAGLDAAQSAGVLHRDVKPGNCFTDTDGTLKIGDFGLSISTLARDVSQSAAMGGFHGTPQFASPEQLRGAPLDVRADIYSVGATLYYLLTGRPPFDERDWARLVSRVSGESPESPRQTQPAVPRGLARIVLRCLAKDAASRPDSYAALAQALHPYASRTSTPANLGLRWVAGVIDYVVLFLPFAIAQATYLARSGGAGRASAVTQMGYQLGSVAYFAVLEGVWGTSVGKWICGLRVVRPNSDRRVGSRALVRSVLYHLSNLALPFAAASTRGPSLTDALIGFVPAFYTAALFLTARRHNGFAAVHDWLTDTRVIERTNARRATVAQATMRIPSVAGIPTSRCGPFDVLAPLGTTAAGQVFVAFDPVLRRTVWVHRMPSGTEPVPPERRDIARPGRLRWIAGARSSEEAWDAYEALDGELFEPRLERKASWDDVKQWLSDLAVELDASAIAEATPPLTFSRVWITAANAAKILDFDLDVGPLSPHASPHDAEETRSPQLFLRAIAQRALLWTAEDQNDHVESLRLPLSARSLLERLAHEGFTSMHDVVAACRALANVPGAVTRTRRAAHLAVLAAPVALVMLSIKVSEPVLRRIQNSESAKDASTLGFYLFELEQRDKGTPPTSLKATELDALEVYVAGRFGPVLADPRIWDTLPYSFQTPHRQMADVVIARHPHVSEEELDAAATTLKKILANREETEKDTAADPLAWWELPATFGGWILILIVIPALASAAMFKGGLALGGLGVAVVRRDGREVSHGRALWRAFVAWLPALVLLGFTAAWYISLFTRADTDTVGTGVFYWLVMYVSLEWMSLIVIVMLAIGAGLAILTPQRGLQDRLAGTWLVPR